MAFLKKIDSHDRQFEELQTEMEKIKQQLPELRVLVKTLQATCEELKESEERARSNRRLSIRIPRILQGLKGRVRKRESWVESSMSATRSASGRQSGSGSAGSGRSDGIAAASGGTGSRSSNEDADEERK